MNGRRPLILTRAGYAGLQRYTAIWTGDNVSTDDHMLTGVRLVNSLGLSGMPNVGMDVGGFTATPPPCTPAGFRWAPSRRSSGPTRQSTLSQPNPGALVRPTRKPTATTFSYATTCCLTCTRRSTKPRRMACRYSARWLLITQMIRWCIPLIFRTNTSLGRVCWWRR